MAEALAGWRRCEVQRPDELLPALLATTPWRCEHIRVYGKLHAVPRRIAWAGDAGVSYRYSRIEHRADGWPDLLRAVRDELQAAMGRRYNFVLLNCYRTGQDAMGWHADDEPELEGDVCSVSLGAERRFRFEDARGNRHSVLLSHGSVIEIPRHLRHCLPRMQGVAEPRINLSFRWVR